MGNIVAFGTVVTSVSKDPSFLASVAVEFCILIFVWMVFDGRIGKGEGMSVIFMFKGRRQLWDTTDVNLKITVILHTTKERGALDLKTSMATKVTRSGGGIGEVNKRVVMNSSVPNIWQQSTSTVNCQITLVTTVFPSCWRLQTHTTTTFHKGTKIKR